MLEQKTKKLQPAGWSFTKIEIPHRPSGAWGCSVRLVGYTLVTGTIPKLVIWQQQQQHMVLVGFVGNVVVCQFMSGIVIGCGVLWGKICAGKMGEIGVLVGKSAGLANDCG